MARAADGYSPHTLADYGHTLQLLTGYANDAELSKVDTAQLRGFFAYLRTQYRPVRASGDDSPLSNHSLANMWCAVRSFYKWAREEGLVAERPDLGIQRPKYVLAEVEPFTGEEIAALLECAEYASTAKTQGRRAYRARKPTAARDKALILLLLDTGLRVSEAARLQVGDVDLVTGEIAISPYQSGKSRGRHVFAGKATRRALWRYLTGRRDGSLFLTQEGRAMDRNSIRLVLTRLGERAGVQRAHPHRFRHTFAIEYLRNGGDVFTLQRFLGHSSLDMVRHYLALAQTDAAAAHQKASPVDRWRL